MVFWELERINGISINFNGENCFEIRAIWHTSKVTERIKPVCRGTTVLENTFQKLDLFLSSGDGKETPTLMSPLEKANLSHRTTNVRVKVILRLMVSRNMAMSPASIRPRRTLLTMPSNNWKLQTRPLVRDGTQQQQTQNSLNIIKWGRRKIGHWSQMGAWHQDRLVNWSQYNFNFDIDMGWGYTVA
jgi:hypothetical protein